MEASGSLMKQLVSERMLVLVRFGVVTRGRSFSGYLLCNEILHLPVLLPRCYLIGPPVLASKFVW